MGTSSSRSSGYPGARNGRRRAGNSSAAPAALGRGHNNGASLPVPAPHSVAPPAALGASATVHTGPGAFSVDSSGPMNVFRVNVPDSVLPGEEFQVYAGNRLVRVVCPPGVSSGTNIQITVPGEPTITRMGAMPQMIQNNSGSAAPVEMPAALREQQNIPEPDGEMSGLPPDSPGTHRDIDGTYTVIVPSNVNVGQTFTVTVDGQQLMVTCPENAGPGMQVRINPPPRPAGDRGPERATRMDRPPETQQTPKPPVEPANQMFEVIVPQGVRPGQPFALMAGGQRVLVTCPFTASAGQRIRFQLPVFANGANKLDGASRVRLSYDKDGWTRTIRVTDMKFQWVRMDDKGDVAFNDRFDMKTSAYVRKLDFVAGVDERMRGGNLSLVPATEAEVNSCVVSANGTELVSYADIANAQTLKFEEKTKWFQDTCQLLCLQWSQGHMQINIRRGALLDDSLVSIMSLSRTDLRKLWRFEFIGEKGIDAGGLAREWYHLVTQELFNPDNGLWKSSSANQMCMDINPTSEVSHPDDHLVYFRFLGRVMGKAMFDRQLVSGHMVQHLYKHLLGWPLTFEDLEMVDEDFYNNLKQLPTIDDVSMLCLDFTSTEDALGEMREIELVQGGADIEVTNENVPEYIECCLKYKLLGRIKPQLTELLLGFYDVIPEQLLTVFDFQEIELLMCGLPEIDIDDWKANTEYSGEYNGIGGRHKVCKWFWEVVSEEFDQELKARLLQFVTGTSGVPARGFSVLQGNDGSIRTFTIHGIHLEMSLFPRAHTCFNRIDLPLYESKKDLKDKLQIALTMAATGFDIE
mmetsp:Transcript_50979/g.75645  ORF Transcript_50979/g.75645 Transcript_50979/m.75645 type:complete len:805 (-) Transcript_50979:602-3016(-)|eukprot:CAMPEP_0195536658 /NCGR_PEP_ID=MMETSP0794_2-20130614/46481_1 /TAXON_ID=515487 /ORGANISM="Stephanopyxis turris, Strain CCMP 815" /LENGTH=804 /DNA_ID=CAMNT_0040670149 /DNA_START=194 /DNA_END=2608 /DNA_ORIENTATION=-